LSSGVVTNVLIKDSIFAENGEHSHTYLSGGLADGVTLGDGVNIEINGNDFKNNSHIDLSLAACAGDTNQCHVSANNLFQHTSHKAFAAIGLAPSQITNNNDMSKWLIEPSVIDCGEDSNLCEFGISIGGFLWYDKSISQDNGVYGVQGGVFKGISIDHANQGVHVEDATSVQLGTSTDESDDIDVVDNVPEHGPNSNISTTCGEKDGARFFVSEQSIVSQNGSSFDEDRRENRWSNTDSKTGCLPNW
jgi:hypothetical protein